ncbi:LysR family transcriptional regulator [Pseudoduganella namucuonensis]|uniref:DNA-binding transcriptional regulator, LysR family n=1 Tax=Pseudoduganella namucuonensis TaxID=1035707 RepID=A0A1I7FUV6_9BURK|nr:LysR family transcriptional regulator [Pseudoduganella namucuonensis]SFU39816.1 DNA-binding transcriptional regulator, LysR family [Pseudoduganella namucuonensis]
MDRLHLMTVFAAVGEEQSFAGGARRLGMSPPAVTRAIAALEARLGVRLLERTTRHVRVTEAGQRYLDDARRIIAEIDEADEAAAGSNAAPRGHLAVTAPVLFGRIYVTPGIVDYLRRYPHMEVNAMFVDRVTNLMEEGLDVGVRIGELPDSSLRAVPVGRVRRVICASPAYLERHGAPRTPRDLAAHTIVSSTGSSAPPDWRFTRDGRAQALRLKPRLTVNSNDAAIEALRDGFGVARLLSYQAAPLLASGELREVLEDYATPGVPVNIVHRDSRQGSPRIRSFVDLMVERLRAEPNLQTGPYGL